MSTKIQSAVLLTCLACASPLAAQSVPEVDERPQARRQLQAPARRPQGGAAQRRAGAAAEATQTISQTARLERGGTFELRNVLGNVLVTGGRGDREVQIQATKRIVSFPNPRAQALLNAILVEVTERGGNVEVNTVHPGGLAGRGGPNRPVVVVDYVVVLPPDSNVILRSTSGTLRLQNVTGDQFELNTLSGDVVMQALRARMLQLHTVTGNMLLQDILAERALVQSTAGNVEYAGDLLPSGRYKLQSHDGRIRVRPTGNPGFDLDAQTVTGRLLSEFALRQRTRPRVVTGPASRALRGQYGNAGAALTALTFSGNIEIVK